MLGVAGRRVGGRPAVGGAAGRLVVGWAAGRPAVGGGAGRLVVGRFEVGKLAV